MSTKYGKNLMVIPVGITVETAKGFLAYATPGSAVIGVYLDDGKFMEAKRNVLNALKVACDGIGANFYEYGVKPQEYEFSELIRLLDELKPDEIYLETVTGPRMLSILLAKVLHEYAKARSIKSYLMLGVEGESILSVINTKSLFTSIMDLGSLQIKTLLFLAERGKADANELAKAVGVSKWTIYKTLSSLIDNGLIERSKRGIYSLTFMGRTLANLLKVGSYG